MLMVPGWKGKIKKESLFLTKCKVFNDYEERYLRSKIRSGDFLSSYPFGIIYKEDKYSILTLDEPFNAIKIDSSSIIPQKNAIETISTYEVIEKYPEAFLEIIFSSLIELLNRKGFNRPIETRSFLGRQSKGILSDRNSIIESYTVEWHGKNRIFSLCNAAEIFRVSLLEKERIFIIAYHPRFEIFEDDFLLPQYSDIGDVLIEKWKEIMLMNQEKIIQRLNKISPIIETLKKCRIIEEISVCEVGDLQEDRIEFPKLESLSGETIYAHSGDELSEKLQNSFIKELSSLSKPKIMIIGDQTNKKQNKISLERIQKIFETLGVKTVLKDFESYYDLNMDFFSSFINQAFIYIIDKDLKGSNGRYSVFKDIMFRLGIPSKVIRYSTLYDKNNDELFRIAILNLLGLIYRFCKIPIWNLNEEIFDLNIAISKTRRFSGYVELLSVSLSYSNQRKNFGELKLQKEEQDDYLYLDNIKKEIFDIFSGSLHEKKILLVVLSEDRSDLIELLINWLRELKAKPILVEIFDKDEGRILECQKEKNTLISPKLGSYVKIGETRDYSEYLMVMTETEKLGEKTGEIEENLNEKTKKKVFQGLPRPLRIRIHSDRDLDDIHALKSIFWNSFLHPTSFRRPRLPIDLIFVKKNQELVFKAKLFGITWQWSVL